MNRALMAPILVAVGCSGSTTSSSTTPARVPTASLTGTVTAAESGRSLDTATVRSLDGVDSSISTTTAADGTYRFLFLPVGNVNLAATFPGYVEGRAGVYVDGMHRLDFALVLRTFVPITGVVTAAATGQPISGVLVIVQPPHIDVGRQATTDSQGAYRLDIQPGPATLRTSARGYSPADGTVVVDGKNTLNFALQAAQP